MDIENQYSFDAALTNGFNLFVGAGFSTLAKNVNDEPLPLGFQLKKDLLREFNMQPLEALDLPKLCTVIKRSSKDELRKYLESKYRVTQFDELYRALDDVAVRSIFTTNIDDLVHRVYETSAKHYINDLTVNGPTYADRAAIDYIPLHGSVLNPSVDFVFSTTEIATAFAASQDTWRLLRMKMREHPTLFCGFRVEDADTLQALDEDSSAARPTRDRWILVHEPTTSAHEEAYFRALGFQIIRGDTQRLLQHFRALQTRSAGGPAVTPGVAASFEGETVPPAARVPAHPAFEFLSGSPPRWSDVYFAKLPRTTHFRRIMNALRAPQHIIVVGGPGSGKSTLLMQAAAEFDSKVHKLVYPEALTLDKAAHIVARLKGEHATIFIDDFSRSIGAVQRLAQEPNIQLACFERDYNFEIVSHRVTGARFSPPMDVTELATSDIQDLWNWIPAPHREEVAPGNITVGINGPPSLFEVVEYFVRRAKLRQRFTGVLQQLSGRPEQALLIMFAYVHSCRTPVSYDMVSAFLHGRVDGYDAIRQTIRNLGRLVSEYDGAMADSNQDHFAQRSELVAEAIIECARTEEFRPVFETFHREVSPLRICAYDVFRRHAFDWKFAKKAFVHWEDGSAFYDAMMELEHRPNPYLMQHAALFLLDRGRSRDAFSRIDEALRVSGNRIFSIRNSHALILFRANSGPEVRDQPEAQAELRRALQILEDCRADDARKTYHVITHANFSLDYLKYYGHGEALQYLEKAKRWVEEEIRRSPWHRALRRVHRELTIAVG